LPKLFDRIDIPFAPVAKPGDLFDDPQLNAGGRMLEIDFPNGARAKIPRLPIEIGDHDFAAPAGARASASTPPRFSPSSALRIPRSRR
jgi:crotonobetainyl-CoA:carnitine CoA-transferase CaiB-like acyl-CoA transferase